MSSDKPACEFIIDSDGLADIMVSSTGNIKAVFLDLIKSGVIAISTSVWEEFKDAYDDEASQIEDQLPYKISMSKKYKNFAASIADGLKSGLNRSPYDKYTDLYTAAIASAEGYTVITSARRAADYQKMNCNACDFTTYISSLDMKLTPATKERVDPA